MPVSKNRNFAKIANDVNSSGNLTADAISADVTLGGATIYNTRSALPVENNTAGDQAYVTENNRLYIWNGSGWYNVALLNLAPTVSSVQDSDGNTTPFILSTEGTPTTITITAADSDGDSITYSATADSDFSGLATLSQDENVFTVTPFSQDSASSESGTITFKATDGINIGSSGVQTFILSFESALWADTVLSIGTSSTDGLDNSTFVDRSTNAHTVTPSGSPVQTAFHPYHPYWSCFFDGDGSSWLSYVSNDFYLYAYDFTFETYFYLDDNSRDMTFFQIGSEDPNFAGTYSSINVGYYVSVGRLRASTPSQSGLGSNSMTGSTDIEANTWYHLALVRNGGTFTIYLNGQVDVSADWGTSSFTTGGTGGARNHIHVAHIYTNSSGRSNELFGKLANYRFLNQNALYTSAFTPPTEPYDDQVSADLLLYINRSISDQSSNEFSPSSSSYTHKMVPLSPFDTIAEYAVGENKGSVYLDGTSYMSLPGSSWINGTEDFTVSAWFYMDPTTLNSGDRSLLGGSVTQGGTSFGIYNFSNNFTLIYTGQINLVFGLKTQIAANEWNLLTFVRSGNNHYLFINGELDSAGVKVSSQDWGGTSYHDIGRQRSGDTNYYYGYIADIQIVRGTALYTANFTPPTAPVGNTNASLYLPMDNAGIFDKTGLNTLTPVGNASTSTTQTKFADTAMYFDGSGDYVQIPASHLNSMGTEDFTIECWLYPTENIGSNHFLDFRGGANSPVLLTVNGTLQYYTNNGVQLNTGVTLSLNTWVHVSLVRSSGVTRYYINGAQNAQTYSDTTDYGSNGIKVGTRTDVRDSWVGYIENLQILKGVAKYTTNFTPPNRTQGRTYQAES